MSTPGDGLKNDWADLQTLTTAWANAVANLLAYTRWPNVAQAVTDGADTDLTGATGSGADQYKVIQLTGALTAGRNVIVTTLVGGWWLISNATSGGFAVTVKTSGGSGVAVPAGLTALLYCDGTNVLAFPSWLPALTLGGDVTLADGKNMVVGTGTGTRIGTATGQKIGFWNKTPVIQPASANQAALTDNTAGTANSTCEALPDPADTPATADALRDDLVANLIPALRNNYADLIRLVNQLRSDLVSVGIIKGSA